MAAERVDGGRWEGRGDGRTAPFFVAIDLETRRVAREARNLLNEVVCDLRDVEIALASLKAWLAVPPEFRREERDRVA